MYEYFKDLIDIELSQDGFICVDIGWWVRFNKSSNGFNDIDVGHGDIMDGTGTNSQVSPSHGSLSGSFILVVDLGRIPWAVSF